MPRMQFGQTMKSSFLESWRPAPGSINTISLLSLDPIATRSHWVDMEAQGIRDRCQCVEGVCCKAFGAAYLTYYFPIFVYNNPGSPEGTFYAWGISGSMYQKLIPLAQAGDLLKFDIQVQAVQQGQGVQTSFTLMPNSQLRSLMAPETLAMLKESVDAFYQSEDKLCKPMTEASYNQLLMAVGYDFKSGLPLPRPQANQPAQLGFYGAGNVNPGMMPSQPAYPTAPQPFAQPQIAHVSNAAPQPVTAPQPILAVATPSQIAAAQPVQAEVAPQAQPTPVAPVAPAAAQPAQAAPVQPQAVNSVPTGAPISPSELASMLQ